MLDVSIYIPSQLVERSHDAIGSLHALHRSFYVYWRGIGTYVPLEPKRHALEIGGRQRFRSTGIDDKVPKLLLWMYEVCTIHW